MTDELTQTVEQADPHRDPPVVDDHAFSPRGRWFTLCRTCGYAEAAHTTTNVAHSAPDGPYDPRDGSTETHA